MRSLTLGVFVRNVEEAVGNTGLRARHLGKQHQAVVFQTAAFSDPILAGARLPEVELGLQCGRRWVHIAAAARGRTHSLLGPILHSRWPWHRIWVCPGDCGRNGNERSESYQHHLGACTGSSPALRAVVLFHQGSYLLFKQAFNWKCIGQCISQCIILHVASHFWVKTRDFLNESS